MSQNAYKSITMNNLVQAQNYANDAKTCLATVYFISALHVRTALMFRRRTSSDVEWAQFGRRRYDRLGTWLFYGELLCYRFIYRTSFVYALIMEFNHILLYILHIAQGITVVLLRILLATFSYFREMWWILACRDSVSPWQNVSLRSLFGLFVGGLQSTWLSVSDNGTHTESPSLMAKSTRRLPRWKCRPYTIRTNPTTNSCKNWHLRCSTNHWLT